jgi:low temperature requirement protein LtrA
VTAADPAREVEVRGARVSTLELFFDLVFVFTVTQMALVVVRDPGWSAVARAFLELIVVYWMYGGFAWLTNAIGSVRPRARVVLLLGMATFLLVSLAVPGAFAADGVAFGWAYLALTVVHVVGFAIGGVPSAARVMAHIGPTNLVAAGLVLAAGYAGTPVDWALWTAAALLQVLSPLPRGRLGSFVVDPAHFGERRGLMIIIVLGESLVSVAVAAQEAPLTAGLLVGALGGLAASAALWFCYFGGDDDRAVAALAGRPVGRRGAAALYGYDAPHVLMMAGVVGIAAGSRLSLPALTEPTTLAAAALISGGAGMYLAGLAVWRLALRFATAQVRALTAVLMLAVIPVGTTAGAGYQLTVLAALVALMLTVERRLAG